MSTPNKKQASFSRKYTHGLYKTEAYVSSSVFIDTETREFRIDVTKGHDTMGNGTISNLPKMIATADMKQDIIDYLIENL